MIYKVDTSQRCIKLKSEIVYLKKEIKRLRKTLKIYTPDLKTILKRRGFHIYKKEPSEDLLIPVAQSHIDEFYNKLKKYSFRLFLRDVIKYQNHFTLQQVSRYANRNITMQYLNYLKEIDLIEETTGGYRLIKRPIKSFGETLEWFISKLMEKEYGADSIWGIKFKRPLVGGDYDLIARVDSSILYMEIKSSPPKQIYDKEISAFLNRVDDLSPEISIFFVDTELRMKDKIVPMFEAELSRRGRRTTPVERLKKEMFHIEGKMFIINSKGSIAANIGTVLSFYFRRD
ncbi:MAG TPA: hypothetical protein DEP99_05710 [Nitrospiraceae bacterium]|nr:hypothetical protein [Nitrospiraceae bacterium]